MSDDDLVDEAGNNLADEIRSGFERAYRALVLLGNVRFEKMEQPYSSLEGKLVNCMRGEIHNLFKTQIYRHELYRNCINGNYIVRISAGHNGNSAGEIKHMLEERLEKAVFGEGRYYGTRAVPIDVRTDDKSACIQLELVMPPKVRYANLARYVRNREYISFPEDLDIFRPN